MTRCRILLADDHELFRQGLAGVLNAQPDLEVVGQAEDGLEAVALTRNLHPNLIVMDINMPLCNGLEATRLIRAKRSRSEVRIIILTIHDEDEQLFEAIKAGANGYLLKSISPADFLHELRRVLAGEAVLPPKLAARVLEEFSRLANRSVSTPESEAVPDLTPRECEVLSLIATGAPDKEIASQLNLSVHTVKSHVRKVLSKLHAANRRQAAKLAKQQGLLWKNRTLSG